MGSYSILYVDHYDIAEKKGEVPPEVASIFREKDKQVWWIDEESGTKSEQKQGDDSFVDVAYVSPVAHVVDRLNVMGFTLRRIRDDFEEARAAMLAELQEDGEAAEFPEEVELLQSVTFDRYLQALKLVLTNKWTYKDCERLVADGVDPIVTRLILETDSYFDEYPHGFFCDDFRALIRAACGVVSQDAEVRFDISDLVLSGYYEADEKVCEDAAATLIESHPENAPRIVLTEGSTDTEFLRDALELLFPHLAPYYTFLDFDGKRVAGGAGQLVTVIKAFAGAGISNRVIAIFDNDTAAEEALRGLAALQLPPTMVALRYPNLEYLERYPTLGPNGSTDLNVNGLAASLELYLGHDVLTAGGQQAPVQWKGYNEALRQYQGEVLGKAAVQDAFREKVRRAREDPRRLASGDWAGMRAIWAAIFAAFP